MLILSYIRLELVTVPSQLVVELLERTDLGFKFGAERRQLRFDNSKERIECFASLTISVSTSAVGESADGARSVAERRS